MWEFFIQKNLFKWKKLNVNYEYVTEKQKFIQMKIKKEYWDLQKGSFVNVFTSKEIIKKSKDKNGNEIEKKLLWKK